MVTIRFLTVHGLAMLSSLTVGLAVAVGAVVLVAGSLAAWRMIPRHHSNISPAQLVGMIEALELRHVELYEKFESYVQREKGRKRKKWEEPEEPAVPSTPAGAEVVQLTGKDELRRQAGLL